jgi:hypothetical protein
VMVTKGYPFIISIDNIRESHYSGYDAPGRNTYRIM